MKWQTIWLLARDILVTGTGLGIIITQLFARSPSDVLLVAALTLTTPSLVAHAGNLLNGSPPSTAGPGPSPPSSPSSPSGPSPASSAPGGPGE